jgi:predicted DNA-binding ribbon-helix-helix protein
MWSTMVQQTPDIVVDCMARPKDGRETHRVSTTLDEHSATRLEAIARANKVTTAWLIRRLIDEFLEKQSASPELDLPLRRRP